MRAYSYLCSIFFLTFICCNNTKKDFKAEDAAVSKVLQVFGGNCKYSIEFNASNKSNAEIFELEISQSPVVAEFSKMLLLPASGIGYTFYSNLPKKRYDKIRVVLILSGNKKHLFEFSSFNLEMVNKKMQKLIAIINAIKLKEYHTIEPLLDNSYNGLIYEKTALIENIKKMELEFSKVIEFIPLGFRFDEINSKKILHISGVIRRESESSYFSADFDTTNKPTNALMINYEL